MKRKTRKALQGQKMRKAASLVGDQSQGAPLAPPSFPRAEFLKDILHSGFFFHILFNQLYIPTALGRRELSLLLTQGGCLGYFRRRKLVLFYRDLKGSQGFSFPPSTSNHLVSPEFWTYNSFKKRHSCILLNRKFVIYRTLEIHIPCGISTYYIV